jgi:peroxiredoxin
VRRGIGTLTILALGLAMMAGALVLGTEDWAAAGMRSTVTVGTLAPDFAATDSKGEIRHLADYRGKIVVLEWTNDGCPFVGKHYRSGNMQALQAKYTGLGVIWLSVVSSAPGEEGYVTASEAEHDTAARGATPTAVLLDPSGALGRLYGARATPHMYVIDTTGRLVYRGAIDDRPSTSLADVATAHNYVAAALDETLAGRAVSVPATTAYGCSVKYAPAG